ncbi:hypothetical protein ACQ4PT_035920 [Festuca glaucescens]
MVEQLIALCNAITVHINPMLNTQTRITPHKEHLLLLEKAKQCVVGWSSMRDAKAAAESKLEAAVKKVEDTSARAQASDVCALELKREIANLKDTLSDCSKLKDELVVLKAKNATLEASLKKIQDEDAAFKVYVDEAKQQVAKMQEALMANKSALNKSKEELASLQLMFNRNDEVLATLKGAARLACNALWREALTDNNTTTILERLRQVPSRVEILKQESVLAGCQKALVQAASHYDLKLKEVSEGISTEVPTAEVPKLEEDVKPFAAKIAQSVDIP